MGAGLIVLASLPFFLSSFAEASRSPRAPTYKGEPVQVWFYGRRKGFFLESTRRSAQNAINDLGTNAFPFLLSILKAERGNGLLYFKLYRVLPGILQAKLPYPLSGDDIKAVTLGHIGQMRPLATEEVRSLAACIPSLGNPRLRMQGFYVMLSKYQTQPCFFEMCRQLLSDKHPGLQLEAAIYLAQSAIQADPEEPRLFPILMAAIQNKEQRKLALDIRGYRYQQQPPGGSGGWGGGLPGLKTDQDEPLRAEIMRALYRLERYLTPAQKDELRSLSRKNSGSGSSPPPEHAHRRTVWLGKPARPPTLRAGWVSGPTPGLRWARFWFPLARLRSWPIL
jgi:hypothetical protein